MAIDIKKTDAGAKYIEVSLSQIVNNLHGAGICDSCNGMIHDKGYLIPVLGRAYCKECFLKSNVQKNFYEEDRIYEDRQLAHFKELLEN